MCIFFTYITHCFLSHLKILPLRSHQPWIGGKGIDPPPIRSHRAKLGGGGNLFTYGKVCVQVQRQSNNFSKLEYEQISNLSPSSELSLSLTI